MATYPVNVTRDSGLWVAEVDGLPPGTIGVTDVQRFADLGSEVRDLVAGLTQADPTSFKLTWRYVIDEQDVTSLFEAVFGAELAYRAAAAARDAARQAVIRTLDEADVPQSAIGDLLGLSHQRVSQLIKAG
ncbi:MAG TPA: hypothetical protein VMB74_02715 [Streptosporangiaceae bacterium]|nr:hypothetical protein [Streptosporangiaceae bacterium]